MKLGRFEVTAIFDGSGLLDARALYVKPDETLDPWSRYPTYLNESGQLVIPIGAFLITFLRHVILIDCGLGGVRNEQFAGGDLLRNLYACGVTPLDVTDVLFTHLHFDHVGWATRQGEVIFPNATYHAHRLDWESFVTAPTAVDGARRKLLPITEQLELFESEHELLPGLTARPVGGHTPGSTIYILKSELQRAMFLGDLVHSPPELLERGWEAVNDVDRALARSRRAQLADEIVDDPNTWVVGSHFPNLKFGRLESRGDDRLWQTVD